MQSFKHVNTNVTPSVVPALQGVGIYALPHVWRDGTCKPIA